MWPAEGKWLPGAVKALQKLDKKYTLIINSARVAPVSFEDWDTPLSPREVAHEVAYIQRMLDEADLGHVEIWQRPFKVPAKAYIDDRGVRFEGNWPKTVRQLNRLGV